jgi:DNA-binding response OmpR family regulator
MAHRPVVMVVEDDLEMNQLERELLDLYGMDAVAAFSGAEAVELSTRCRTDAILLDIMLPEMDGFEACRRIRCNCDSRVPVIILSALDSDDCRRRGYEAGASAYFSKPFDPAEVVHALQELIARAAGSPQQPEHHPRG